MPTKDKKVDRLLRDLQERAKELNCLYRVEEQLSRPEATLDEMFEGIVEVLPSGWQYPDLCRARITYEDRTYESSGFQETSISQSAEIVVQGRAVGQVIVVYLKDVPKTSSGYFLEEESKLIETVADRLGHTVLHQELKRIYRKWEGVREDILKRETDKWRSVVDTLRRSDRKLYIYVARKMLRNLCLYGVDEANLLLKEFGHDRRAEGETAPDDANRPSQKQTMDRLLELGDTIFQMAAEKFDEDQILSNIEKWIREDKSRDLVKAIDNPESSLSDVIDAITRYRLGEAEGIELSSAVRKGLRVSLIRRFFYEQLDFINIAKKYIDIEHYYGLVNRVICHPESHGNLGGKSAGLFLAERILEEAKRSHELLRDVKTPKSWYVTTDSIMNFLYYNDLGDVNEQKYKDIEEIRFEYPNIVQIFKHAHFPPRIVAGLSNALDDFGERPIVVRSSSLLEDRVGAVFSGKYKSLFLANQGSKEERMAALLDAIAEVYASTFAPDPIEYRTERGLLDFNEEMGIMIQEVVGTKVGEYFLPMFAGVAFSNNEFRWSPRIRPEDGLIRMTPGLGTRAVDRVAEDYPVLIAPGEPQLRVNATPDEAVRYSPKRADVINLETNRFETVDLSDLLKEYGNQLPGVQHMVSVFDGEMIHHPSSVLNLDFAKDSHVFTFEGLFRRTPFIEQIRTMMDVLREKLGTLVDIEFAHDGKSLYLLQCRPQSHAAYVAPATIPKDIPENRIVFSANRYVSNGLVSDITYIVYVDPAAYGRVSNHEELTQIGRVVGMLNKKLPKRQFVLLGPGRWGSRGDIKLGINVTYSDINRTAMLIEIARRKGNYVPELSFGTHFFQDLVESSIRYLPLYPDEDDNVFNEEFLLGADNCLAEMLPDHSSFSHIVRVIDVSKSTEGLVLCVLMNAEHEQAVGFLTQPGKKTFD